jgi:hypothetical protein
VTPPKVVSLGIVAILGAGWLLGAVLVIVALVLPVVALIRVGRGEMTLATAMAAAYKMLAALALGSGLVVACRYTMSYHWKQVRGK